MIAAFGAPPVPVLGMRLRSSLPFSHGITAPDAGTQCNGVATLGNQSGTYSGTFCAVPGILKAVLFRYCWRQLRTMVRKNRYRTRGLMVGAARFELATPSPPDWCANRAALRSVPAIGGL